MRVISINLQRLKSPKTIFTILLLISFLQITTAENNIDTDTNTDTDTIQPITDSPNISPLTNPNPINPTNNQPLPEAHVILPIRRKDTVKAQMNVAPCGGVPKIEAHTLTDKASQLDVVWETIVPIADGNCTVRLSPGLEIQANFTTLYPKDIQTNKDGSFACGRSDSFESHQFKLPDDYVCDLCTIQWQWSTPVGDIYSCSDITINGNRIEGCMAMCQNGGSCFNGKCLCVNGYYGEFCENDRTSSSSSVGWILLVLLLFIVAGGAIYYFATNKVSI